MYSIYYIQRSSEVHRNSFKWIWLREWNVTHSPIIVTSYSVWKMASWLHCANTVRASLWLALCKGTPSTLRSRSPAFNVPSLHKDIKQSETNYTLCQSALLKIPAFIDDVTDRGGKVLQKCSSYLFFFFIIIIYNATIFTETPQMV